MSDALTVVYQDLSADEKRVIINDSRVAITEMREIDRIASELQDTCHSQAKWIAEQDALLRQALEAMQSAMQSHGVILASDPPQDAWKFYGVGNKMNGAIAAIKERLK